MSVVGGRPDVSRAWPELLFLAITGHPRRLSNSHCLPRENALILWPMADDVLKGSCLCGVVTYQVRAPFFRFAHCHCSRCCKATGSGHATNLYVAPDHFEWTSGRDSTVRFDLPSARSFATTFCRHCGSPLPHHTRSGREVVVPAGSLDQAPNLEPQARIFWSSRASWSCMSDDVPRYAELPEWW